MYSVLIVLLAILIIYWYSKFMWWVIFGPHGEISERDRKKIAESVREAHRGDPDWERYLVPGLRKRY